MGESVLEQVRAAIGDCERVYLAPDIPRVKLAMARSAHAAHLAEDEDVLALYDDTAFGGAREGFLITERRFCWKNLIEDARQVEWRLLAPECVKPVGGGVQLGLGQVDLTLGSDIAGELAGLLRTLAASHRVGRDGTVSTRDFVLLTAQRHLGATEDVYFTPDIPGRKLAGARRSMAEYLQGDEILVLFDDTVFGSAEEGFVLTERRVCWKNIAEHARANAWLYLDPSAVCAGSSAVLVGDQALTVTARSELIEPAVHAFRDIARWVRGEDVLSPVPAGTVPCPHCGRGTSPTARRCGHCGAAL